MQRESENSSLEPTAAAATGWQTVCPACGSARANSIDRTNSLQSSRSRLVWMVYIVLKALVLGLYIVLKALVLRLTRADRLLSQGKGVASAGQLLQPLPLHTRVRITLLLEHENSPAVSQAPNVKCSSGPAS
jgi:hypothetical protein